MRTHPPMVPKCPKWSTILVQTVQNGPHFWTYFDSHKLEQNKIRSKCLSMNVFQSYFSKFSQGTCSQHAVNTQKRPLSKKKACKKVHFFPKYEQKIPLSPRRHAKKSTFARKSTPPNPDLATGLKCFMYYVVYISCG